MKTLVEQSLSVRTWILMGMVFCLIGCGSSTPTPPVIPTTPTTGYPVYGGGSCGGVGGTPIRNDNTPFYSYLNGSNSLELSIYYANYNNIDIQVQSVVASGTLVMPDIMSIAPSGGQQGQTQGYTYCVSTATQGGRGAGYLNLATRAIALTMAAGVTIPQYQSYGGGTYGYPQMYPPMPFPESITVSLSGSQYCPTRLEQGRIVGCVSVDIVINQGYSRIPYNAMMQAQ